MNNIGPTLCIQPDITVTIHTDIHAVRSWVPPFIIVKVSLGYWKGVPWLLDRITEAGSVAVFPPHCGPLSLGSIPVPALYVHLVSSPNLLPRVFPGVLRFSSCISNWTSLVCFFLFAYRTLLESSACALSKASLYKDTIEIACTVDSYLMRNLSLRLVLCFARAGHIMRTDESSSKLYM